MTRKRRKQKQMDADSPDVLGFGDNCDKCAKEPHIKWT